jgi:hypothetical protein
MRGNACNRDTPLRRRASNTFALQKWHRRDEIALQI